MCSKMRMHILKLSHPTSHEAAKVMKGPDTPPKQSKRAQIKATHGAEACFEFHPFSVFHDHDCDEP